MKRFLTLVLALLMLLSLFPTHAGYASPQAGDILLVTVSSAPLYASYNTYDYTVITNVPQGSTVMFISSVAKGYCVAYQNFVGYINASCLTPATSSYYRFRMPDGSAYNAIVNNREEYIPSWGYPQVTPTPTPTPKPTTPPYYDWGSASPTADPSLANPRVPTMDFTAVPVKAIKNIYTRSGPGTYYTSPGQFGSGKSYVAYYQTKNDSANWSYIEFSQDGEKYRAYTPSNRFNKDSAADFETENVVYITVTQATPLYYGPGYDYAQSSYGKIYAHSSIRAFYQENGWVLIEYLLSSGETHRGWVPAGYWHD